MPSGCCGISLPSARRRPDRSSTRGRVTLLAPGGRVAEPVDFDVRSRRSSIRRIASLISRLCLSRTPGAIRSQSNSVPNVRRLETRKKQNALIIRCRSVAVTSDRNAPDRRPRASSRASVSITVMFCARNFSDRAMCSPLWMFSMLTSRMKSGCASS